MRTEKQLFCALVHGLFVLSVATFLCPLLFAPGITINQAIDKTLDMNPNVVAATVEDVGSKPTFRVNQILHAQQEQFSSYVSSNANRIILARGHRFQWPQSLSPFEPGQFVIAFFREMPGELPQGWDGAPYLLLTVVPTSKRIFSSNQSLSDICILIRNDLINQMKVENSSSRQLALLRFVFPILRKQDAGIIQSFLQHSETRHHQTARALLLALTRDPKYIPAVEKDLEPVMQQTPPDTLYGDSPEMEGLCGHNGSPLGICDYSHLARFDATKDRVFPSATERTERAPLLPLYRWVIEKAKDARVRWELGIKPLAYFGTEADYPLLDSVSSEVDEFNRRHFSDALYYLKHGHLPPQSEFISMDVLRETPSSLSINVSYDYIGDLGEKGILIECHASGRSLLETHAPSFTPALVGKHAAHLELHLDAEAKTPLDTNLVLCNFARSRTVSTGGAGFTYKKTWSR
jgi:hypothetical protein